MRGPNRKARSSCQLEASYRVPGEWGESEEGGPEGPRGEGRQEGSMQEVRDGNKGGERGRGGSKGKGRGRGGSKGKGRGRGGSKGGGRNMGGV